MVYKGTYAVFLSLALIMVVMVMMTVVMLVLVVVIIVVVIIVIVVMVMMMLVLVVVVIVMVVMMMIVFILVIVVVVIIVMLVALINRNACLSLICLSPACGGDSLFKVIALSIKYISYIHLAVAYLDYPCVGLESLYHSFYTAKLLRCHLVHLVEDDGGAELDLLNEQVLDVLLVDALLEKVVAAAELGRHSQGIHHGNDVVKAAYGREAPVPGLALENGYGLGNGHGLAYA